MAKTGKPGELITMSSENAIAGNRLINGAGEICTAGQKAIGVSYTSNEENGTFSVVVSGSWIVEAGATVSKGDEIEPDASGKGIPLSTGKLSGVSLHDVGAGELFEMVVK